MPLPSLTGRIQQHPRRQVAGAHPAPVPGEHEREGQDRQAVLGHQLAVGALP